MFKLKTEKGKGKGPARNKNKNCKGLAGKPSPSPRSSPTSLSVATWSLLELLPLDHLATPRCCEDAAKEEPHRRAPHSSLSPALAPSRFLSRGLPHRDQTLAAVAAASPSSPSAPVKSKSTRGYASTSATRPCQEVVLRRPKSSPSTSFPPRYTELRRGHCRQIRPPPPSPSVRASSR